MYESWKSTPFKLVHFYPLKLNAYVSAMIISSKFSHANGSRAMIFKTVHFCIYVTGSLYDLFSKRFATSEEGN